MCTALILEVIWNVFAADVIVALRAVESLLNAGITLEYTQQHILTRCRAPNTFVPPAEAAERGQHFEQHAAAGAGAGASSTVINNFGEHRALPIPANLVDFQLLSVSWLCQRSAAVRSNHARGCALLCRAVHVDNAATSPSQQN